MNEPIRVLLVDDDVDQLALCSRWLTLSGYQVDSAPGGAEALASLERTRPDLVVTDLAMLDELARKDKAE